MKKVTIVISYLLMLFGAFGFISGGLISLGIIEYDNELPLGDIKGIVVDSSGIIYIGLGEYSKIQCYDNTGSFIRNWSIAASGGAFNIDLDQKQNIIISTAKGDRRIVYNNIGEIISTEIIDNIYPNTINDRDIFISEDGAIFKVDGQMFPIIIRENKDFSDSHILISQPMILSMLKGPMPAWLIFAFGLILNYILRQDLIDKRMLRFTTHNNV